MVSGVCPTHSSIGITEKSVDERTGNGIGFIRQNGVLDAAAVQLRKRFTHTCIRLGEIVKSLRYAAQS